MVVGMRGPDGRVLGLGGMSRKYVDFDAAAGALPSTVTTPVGTATFGGLPAAVGTPSGSLGATGYLQVTSGNVSGNEGQVQAQPILRTADFRTIRARVRGLKFDSQDATLGFYVRFRGSSNMLSFGQEYTAQTASVIRPGGSDPAIATQFNLCKQGDHRAAKSYTVEIGMSLPLKEAWVQVGDSKPVTFPVAGAFDHNVRFQVGVITREAASHYLQMATMELWGEHY